MYPVLFKNEVALETTTQAKQYTKMHYSGILLDIKIVKNLWSTGDCHGFTTWGKHDRD